MVLGAEYREGARFMVRLDMGGNVYATPSQWMTAPGQKDQPS